MLIKETSDMTDSERMAVRNQNFLYLEIKQGTVEIDGTVWTYEKSASGTVKMWCMVSVTYVNRYILEKNLKLPVTLAENGIGWATINEYSASLNDFDKNAKVLCKTGNVAVLVHDSTGSFTEQTTVNVALLIIGRWK